MSKAANDIELLMKVSIYYYNEGMTQQEIAVKLGITRQSVSKYLDLAKERGIVEIHVKNPIPETTELEKKLIGSFPESRLKSVGIAPGNFNEHSVTRRVIAQRACEYLADMISNGNYGRIGLSWGRTVKDMITELSDIHLRNRPEIIPMLGSTDNSIPYFMMNDMAVSFASKLNGITRQIFLPLDTECSEDYAHYTSTRQYEKLLRCWSSLDMAIVGIGANPLQSETRRSLYPREPEIVKSIEELCPVGDVCTRYYDIDGKPIFENSGVLIAISTETIKKIPRVLGIAGGPDKVQSIVGAIRSGIITDLVTDERTAEAILSYSENGAEPEEKKPKKRGRKAKTA